MINSPKISVVIPYFQRESGILRKTVLSALAQRGSLNYEIIVVDDQSPIPAEDEIGDLLQNNKEQIRIIHQSNAGPGAARNKGIESVSLDTVYIAFLDSDDCWLEQHLENALFALNKGYDFYFSDFYFPTFKEKSAFERGGKISREDHICLDLSNDIYEYKENMTDQILIKGNVIGTPTVVYRYTNFSQLRFREEFYNGQDYLFWLDFSETDGKIVVSFQKECDCGSGLNIYAGAGWGTERSLKRLKNELFLWKSVNRMYSLTRAQKKSNTQKINILRESLARDILHRLTHSKHIAVSLLLELIKLDLALLFLLPLFLLKIALFRTPNKR